MKLYHFSEEGSIATFKPRVKDTRKDMPPVVWAIDETHQFSFYFPRLCPRIVYTKSNHITETDDRKFFGTTSADIVVTVEANWLQRILNTTLFRYELPTQTFSLFDEIAGYYISPVQVEPVGMEPIKNGVERLLEANIELRITTDLNRLRAELLNSSIQDFGIHQFDSAIQRNSRVPPETKS